MAVKEESTKPAPRWHHLFDEAADVLLRSRPSGRGASVKEVIVGALSRVNHLSAMAKMLMWPMAAAWGACWRPVAARRKHLSMSDKLSRKARARACLRQWPVWRMAKPALVVFSTSTRHRS